MSRARCFILAALLLSPAGASALPDLAVTHVEAPAVLFAGRDADVRFTVVNLGDAPAIGPFVQRIYLSRTDTITLNDTLLWSGGALDRLDPGRSEHFDVTVTIPESVADGTWWIGVITDPFDVVDEPNLRNNARATDVSSLLRRPAPNLDVREVRLASTAAAGETLPVTVSILNSGNESADFDYGIYLSVNDVVSPHDFLLFRAEESLDPDTLVSFTSWVRLPPSLAAGDYHVGVIADPDDLLDEVDKSGNVAVADGPLSVGPPSLVFHPMWVPEAVVGAPMSWQFEAQGGTGDYRYRIAAGELPPGVAIGETTGRLHGTPTEVGEWPFVLEVGSGGLTAAGAFTLMVTSPSVTLEVQTRYLPPAIVGDDYLAHLAAVGGRPPYQWSVTGPMPSGLSLAPEGVVGGVPISTGVSELEVRVRDARGATSTARLGLRVVDATSLTITTQLLPPAQVDTTFLAGFDAIGGRHPLTWSVAGGALPPGLTLEATTGILTGVPQHAGRHAFQVRVSDADGLTDLNAVALDVVAPSLAIVTRDLARAEVGEPYDQALAILPSSGTAPFRWWVRSGYLPDGLALDADGRIEGTPTTGGTFPLILAAEDARGATGWRAFALEVVDPARTAELARAAESSGGCAAAGGRAGAGLLLLLFAALLRLGRRRQVAPWLAALVVATTATGARADADDYSLVVQPEIYAPIEGGTPVVFSDPESAYTTVQLPFTFRFYNQPYTSLGLSTNGIILFGTINDSHSNNRSIPSEATPSGFVAPWWDDLDGSLGEVTTHVEGVAPGRAFVVQYRDWYRSPQRSRFNFQVRFYESSNIIKVNYGPATVQGDESGASVGIESPDGKLGVLALACTPLCVSGDFPSGTSMIYARLPDLVTVGASAPPAIDRGLPARIHAEIHNAGGQEAGPFRVHAYLSDRDRFDGDAHLLAEYAEVPALGVDATVPVEFDVEMPPDLEADRFYYLFVVPNADGSLLEVRLDNNPSAALPAYAREPMPNFRAEPPFAESDTVAPGETVRVAFTVRNTGNLGAVAPYRLVLSDNRVISREDLPIHEGTLDLAPGEARTLTRDLLVPSDLDTGAYYLGVIVDPDGTVDELDELDNAAASATRIAVTGSDIVVLTDGLPDAQQGQPYHAVISAAGGAGDFRWSLTTGVLPEGLVLHEDGRIEGSPREAGTFRLRLMVQSGDTSALANLDLTVADPSAVLAAVSHQLPLAVFGWEYETRLRAAGGVPPYRWRVSAGSLPAGLALAEDGWLGGVPAVDGAHEIDFTVADENGTEATVSLDLDVAPSPNLVVVTQTLPAALLGEPYTHTLRASGGTPPHRWRADGLGRLPRGLALAEDGTLHGEATEVGVFDVTVRVEDARARSDTNSLTLVVSYDQGIHVTTEHLPVATFGRTYDVQLRASGGTEPYVWRLAGRELPPGLSLDESGRIHGVPVGDQALVYPFAVEVVDEAGRRDLKGLAVRVDSAPEPPEPGGCSTAGGGAWPAAALLLVAGVVLGRRPPVRFAVLPAAGLVLVLLAAGCGNRDLCADSACPAGTVCSPDDGACHCGGPGGEICEGETVCDPLVGRCHALVDECGGVRCEGGTTCDPSDGTCRCGGSAGPICEEGTVCETTTGRCIDADRCEDVACEGDASCDPVTGLCVCGDDAEVCEDGTRCQDGSCALDPCRNVSCPSGTLCDPEDATCRCGGTDGEVCGDDEVCDPVSGACVAAASCRGVTCTAGTTCDPNDGICKCGGLGGEVCAPDQSCDLSTFACAGGDPCRDVTCTGGTTCDPEDGVCRCGGRGGEPCEADEVCLTLGDLSPFCTPVCDPVFQDCEDGKACYYSTTLGRTFCHDGGTTGAGSFCAASTQCEVGLHCDTRDESRRCRLYCDTGVGYPQAGSCPLNHFCEPVFHQRPALGLCQSSL